MCMHVVWWTMQTHWLVLYVSCAQILHVDQTSVWTVCLPEHQIWSSTGDVLLQIMEFVVDEQNRVEISPAKCSPTSFQCFSVNGGSQSDHNGTQLWCYLCCKATSALHWCSCIWHVKLQHIDIHCRMMILVQLVSSSDPTSLYITASIFPTRATESDLHWSWVWNQD